MAEGLDTRVREADRRGGGGFYITPRGILAKTILAVALLFKIRTGKEEKNKIFYGGGVGTGGKERNV